MEGGGITLGRIRPSAKRAVLQRGDQALFLGQPRAQGEPGIVGGRPHADLSGHLPLHVDPAQTGRELRRMNIDPTTAPLHDFYRVSLLVHNQATFLGMTRWSSHSHL